MNLRWQRYLGVADVKIEKTEVSIQYTFDASKPLAEGFTASNEYQLILEKLAALPEASRSHALERVKRNLQMVAAIVAQDEKNYPKGNAALLSTSGDKFSNTVYVMAGEAYTLQKLACRLRRALGMESDHVNPKTGGISYGQIIKLWRRYLGVKVAKASDIEIDFHFEPQAELPKEFLTSTEYQIILEKLAALSEDERSAALEKVKQNLQMVATIVAADHKLYPERKADFLSTSPNKRNKFYIIAGEIYTLNKLAGNLRRALGLRGVDTDPRNGGMSNWFVVELWRRYLGVAVTIPSGIAIAFHFEPQAEYSAGFITSAEYQVILARIKSKFTKVEDQEHAIATVYKNLQMVAAIVAQDEMNYPGENAALLSTSKNKFSNPVYLFADEAYTLKKLAGRLRIALGLGVRDKGPQQGGVAGSQVIALWKRYLFSLK